MTTIDDMLHKPKVNDVLVYDKLPDTYNKEGQSAIPLGYSIENKRFMALSEIWPKTSIVMSIIPFPHAIIKNKK